MTDGEVSYTRAVDDTHVLVYFGEDPSRAYQVVQWLDVLADLSAERPVTLVLRDPDVASLLLGRTRLPVVTAVTYPELTAAYDDLDAKVVLYVNNSPTNFASLVDAPDDARARQPRRERQAVHGDNNAKAYDRVLSRARRPSAVTPRPSWSSTLAAGARGPAAARPCGASPCSRPRRGVRCSTPRRGRASGLQRLHVPRRPRRRDRAGGAGGARRPPGLQAPPQIVTSLTPAVAEAHLAVLGLVEQAAAADPDAGHTGSPRGTSWPSSPTATCWCADVSSVGLDWLYLALDQPLLLTDRHDDAERLRPRGAGEPQRRRAHDAHRGRPRRSPGRTAGPRRAPPQPPPAAPLLLRRPGVGESTVRFLRTISDLCDRRDLLQGRPGAEITA